MPYVVWTNVPKAPSKGSNLTGRRLGIPVGLRPMTWTVEWRRATGIHGQHRKGATPSLKIRGSASDKSPMALRAPGEALDDFVEREREEGVVAINVRDTALCVTNARATYDGMDTAVKNVALAHSAEAIQKLGLRRRAVVNASGELSGAWLCGYIYARAVYGPLTPLKYSDSEEQSQVIGQSLVDFAEAIDRDGILGTASFQSFNGGIESSGAYPTILKKAGQRFGSAAVLTSWAMGIAIAIAEHEMFVEVSPPRLPS